LWLAWRLQCWNVVETRSIKPAARHRRLWQTIRALRHRMRQERELLVHPGMELAAARQLARSQRRLEVLSSQLR
jgi:hypothetical protein